MCSFDFVFYFLLSFQPVTPQILTGFIFHPLFPGAILPTSQATPEVQNGILSAGQAGANPAIRGTSEGPFPTTSGTDDDFSETTPVGIQRGIHTTEETTTGSPKCKFSKPGKCPRAVKVICRVREEFFVLSWQIQIPVISGSPLTHSHLIPAMWGSIFTGLPTQLDLSRKKIFNCWHNLLSMLRRRWKYLETDSVLHFPSPPRTLQTHTGHS